MTTATLNSARTNSTASTTTTTNAVHDKFSAARRELSASLIERDEDVDMTLTALVAREHVFFLSPPGYAKSMLIDNLLGWLHASKFATTLMKFSAPEDVFGPISIPGLKAEDYRRVIDGYLPTADIAFLDEIFKASPAILNSLLTILNERKFRNGKTMIPVPLRFMMAASNEGPESAGDGLAALWDRFLFRKRVLDIESPDGEDRLTFGRDTLVARFTTSATLDDIDQAHAEARALPLSEAAIEAIREIKRKLKEDGINPSPRRRSKIVMPCQAYAWLEGADEVRPEHLTILSHVLWEDFGQAQRVATIVHTVATPVSMEINSLRAETQAVLRNCNMRDLGQTIECSKKLEEVLVKLVKFRGNPKGDQTTAFVRAELKRIKLAAVDSF